MIELSILPNLWYNSNKNAAQCAAAHEMRENFASKIPFIAVTPSLKSAQPILPGKAVHRSRRALQLWYNSNNHSVFQAVWVWI